MPSKAPWWRPDIFARRRPMLELRSRLTSATRAFFGAHGFLEVETPALQISPGLEPHLMAFATELVAADQQTSQPFYLHTSPEFAMKKLLAAGLPRISNCPMSSATASGPRPIRPSSPCWNGIAQATMPGSSSTPPTC